MGLSDRPHHRERRLEDGKVKAHTPLRQSEALLSAFLPPHSCTASPQRKASLRLRTNETMESGVACTSLPACCCTRRPGASASASSQQSYRPLEQPSPRSASYSCPLAMTDGAARLLEVHMKGRRDLQQLYERLTTRDADRFYTSGQVGLCIALHCCRFSTFFCAVDD